MCDRSKKHRHSAYIKQSGLCYYCDRSMWESTPAEFAKQHHLTLQQAQQLQCTAEHLQAKKDGGRNSKRNVVAACLFCNQERHKHDTPRSPVEHKFEIQRRFARGLRACFRRSVGRFTGKPATG